MKKETVAKMIDHTLLAARNAGIKTVCVPAKNEKDVLEISQEITAGLEIVYVDHLDQVIDVAFC